MVEVVVDVCDEIVCAVHAKPAPMTTSTSSAARVSDIHIHFRLPGGGEAGGTGSLGAGGSPGGGVTYP